MRSIRKAGLLATAALLLVGAGDVPRVSAADAHVATFVPITPCRLMDTRATSTVGPRNTPIGPGETYSALVWGSNGTCVIPEAATAVSLNVTFVGPTSAGFVTVFPPDQPWPGTSNLNFVAGQAPAPNGVTSPLSFDGKIAFFNAAGTVNLIADIVGYYESAGSPDADTVLGACSAQLRWDLDHCKPTAYATGDHPAGIAFDGTSLWVVNSDNETVSRMNPATGTKTDFPVGENPTGAAFDGTSIWVANQNDDTVSKINPATGTRNDFPTGVGPVGVAFDGTSIWVTNSADATVSRINPTTGARTDFGTGVDPDGIAFDGTNIWVTNANDNTISKINPATGATLLTPGTDDTPRGVAFDGTSIWIANFVDDTVSKMDPVTGNRVDYPTADGPVGVAFDGTSIWVTAVLDDEVTKINPQSGAAMNYGVGDEPTGVAFDGSNIWVTNSGSDTVSKMLAGRGVLENDPVGSTDSSSFVPITPCRLMDTRSTSTVGPRGTPIGPGETYSALVWGTNGNCTIPPTATALSLNVTFVGPTAAGFVTVFPPDKPWPGTSNLNFSAGQAPAPNGVTSPLSADGKIGFFNAAGTVNLIADIVGYYEVAGSAPGGLVMGHCGALLRWDLPGCRAGAFATGNNPSGIAFDGTSIWVANEEDNTISKINPTTGAKVDYPTGNTPMAVAFDGSNIWVTNDGSDTVSKIDPATGTRVDYPTGQNPRGVLFDGRNIWVSNSTDDTVSKIDPDTGSTLISYNTDPTPWGMAFDGTSLWIANYNGTNVSRMNPNDGTKSDFDTEFNPIAVVFDGSSIWVANIGSASVTKMDPSSGSSTDFATPAGPRGIAYDGTNLWIANAGDDTVSKMNPSDGSRVDYAVGDGPTAIAFDGGNVWVTNSVAKTVSKVVASGSGLRLSAVAAEGSSAFVPVTPCRLMDTRTTSQIGPRGTPIMAGETYSALVWGTNGTCTIPATATALSLNVTFVGPTSAGFVTVYPPDQPWPGTSNLNFIAGQAPAPNGVTSPLSFDGKIGFFNAAGTVNLIADIVGYYEPVEPITTRCLWTLRWDLAACDRNAFDTGDFPTGLAFDGTSIWIANSNADSVTKLDPVTGVGTDFPVGDGPDSVAFDGTFIWVTNTGDGTVSKVNPSTGVEVDVFTTPSGPMSILFDGTSIWIACQGGAGSVAKMDPATGTYDEEGTGLGARGVAFDGQHIWVTNGTDDTVTKIDRATATKITDYPTLESPFGIAFDGTNLWIANLGNTADSVSKMDPATGNSTEYAHLQMDGTTYFAFDGHSMWVTNQNISRVYRIDITTGDFLPVVVGDYPYGIVFDGENLWITRAGYDKVEKLVI